MTAPDQREQEKCGNCGHRVAKHYKDPRGVYRCLVVKRGETTSGVIGLPYEHECDCEQFHMPEREPSR